jgi:hypothetical protein
MNYFHVVAKLSADRQKSLVNRSADEVLSNFILPFLIGGTITAKWGKKTQTYQVLELRVYQTTAAWNKKSGQKLEAFLKGSRNIFFQFEKKAKQLLARNKHRVFIIMPIQGEKYGSQDKQRIFREYDDRFKQIEIVLEKYDCVAIRIDKEAPLESLVDRIKEEIVKAKFLIADLTDERPSCYYEAGYADALSRPTIFIASKESVVKPGTDTRIHFDIHKNVQFFTNHTEMAEKLTESIERNREKLVDT